MNILERNKIYCIDVLEGLRQLDDNSVDLIITSPPYNKAGLNGKRKTTHNDIWNKTINYSDDADADCMPEEEYQKWQEKVLVECYRVLKSDGSLFYVHKNRIKIGMGYCITPYQWILKTPFLFRQEITWDKCGTPNMDPSRYIVNTEKIFWLTKTKKVRYRRQKNLEFQGEVWRLKAQQYTEHPAPFPINIPDNIIPNVAQGERILVVDPFCGSGTVPVSAVKNGCDYIGFEKFQMYVDMANKRLTRTANHNITNQT